MEALGLALQGYKARGEKRGCPGLHAHVKGLDFFLKKWRLKITAAVLFTVPSLKATCFR